MRCDAMRCGAMRCRILTGSLERSAWPRLESSLARVGRWIRLLDLAFVRLRQDRTLNFVSLFPRALAIARKHARTHARLRNGVCAPSRCATSASLHWSRWQGPIPPETPAFCARERHLICRLCRRERRGDVPALRPSRGAPSSCAGRLGEAVLTGHRFRAPDFRRSARGGSRLRGDREAPRKPLCAHSARFKGRASSSAIGPSLDAGRGTVWVYAVQAARRKRRHATPPSRGTGRVPGNLTSSLRPMAAVRRINSVELCRGFGRSESTSRSCEAWTFGCLTCAGSGRLSVIGGMFVL